MLNASKLSLSALVLLLLFVAASSPVYACGFDGHLIRGDGSKVSGTARVTSSWNSKKAEFPRPGYYFLELGPDACGEKIELFINGYSMGRYNIPRRGMATVDVKLKGDTPIR
jgi:hypothetical protein